jgi:ABC-type branched-subunit amino acid transport system ATPase component
VTDLILEARGIGVSFGGLRALDDVSLAVPPNGFVGLMGPNGAGKSTLFAVLSGLLRPKNGNVLMDGDVITRRSIQYRAGRGLSRTFQRLELFGELTVRDHLVVARRIRTQRWPVLQGLFTRRGGGSAEETAEVDAIIGNLGLESVARMPAHSLPLGTGRLVEVARALAGGPRVLLLDEPSSGLDDSETARLADTLRRVHSRGDIALVLVEHNVDLVLSLVDTVTVLDFGRIIATGTPDEIRHDPAVQTAYLGTAAT